MEIYSYEVCKSRRIQPSKLIKISKARIPLGHRRHQRQRHILLLHIIKLIQRPRYIGPIALRRNILQLRHQLPLSYKLQCFNIIPIEFQSYESFEEEYWDWAAEIIVAEVEGLEWWEFHFYEVVEAGEFVVAEVQIGEGF